MEMDDHGGKYTHMHVEGSTGHACYGHASSGSKNGHARYGHGATVFNVQDTLAARTISS